MKKGGLLQIREVKQQLYLFKLLWELEASRYGEVIIVEPCKSYLSAFTDK